ncbi:MAG: hypothetical protein CVV27_18940 [Candidatus Melainabacteria bacterium HGW-Melainabacteria-1]|nr:MAG: hypothetical protein CVV27_18940 [Candidatus Melainabacteria bacterium HGW-Melainabacteria-1]
MAKLLAFTVFLFAAQPVLAASANPCQNAYLPMPAHKVARPQACLNPAQTGLRSVQRQWVSWGQPVHKLATQQRPVVSHVLPVELPQTPATANWSIPAHQIAKRTLRNVAVRDTADMQGRRLARR